MAFNDVGDMVKSGQAIVVGIIVIGVTAGIGLYIVTQLNAASNNSLPQAVILITNALGPVGGGLQFFGLTFLVMGAVVVIKLIRKAGE